MKTKTFILLSLLICNLLPAQNVKLDIKPHFLGVRADSLFVSMDISVEIEDMNPKNAVILTPILTGQDRKILLPAIQLNGKQKQKLYVRNQILRKKKNSFLQGCAQCWSCRPELYRMCLQKSRNRHCRYPRKSRSIKN